MKIAAVVKILLAKKKKRLITRKLRYHVLLNDMGWISILLVEIKLRSFYN